MYVIFIFKDLKSININIKTWQVSFQRNPMLNENRISREGLHEPYELEKYNCEDRFWSHFLFSATAASPVLVVLQQLDFKVN